MFTDRLVSLSSADHRPSDDSHIYLLHQQQPPHPSLGDLLLSASRTVLLQTTDHSMLSVVSDWRTRIRRMVHRPCRSVGYTAFERYGWLYTWSRENSAPTETPTCSENVQLDMTAYRKRPPRVEEDWESRADWKFATVSSSYSNWLGTYLSMLTALGSSAFLSYCFYIAISKESELLTGDSHKLNGIWWDERPFKATERRHLLICGGSDCAIAANRPSERITRRNSLSEEDRASADNPVSVDRGSVVDVQVLLPQSTCWMR